MDRLPWGRFHWLVIIGLGITWVLDGLSVTLVGAIGSALEKPDTLSLSTQVIALQGTVYIAGAITGSLFFGYLTDLWGRKRLFSITLFVFLVGTVATAFAFDAWSLLFFRFLTGLGVGGEYSAINSAIDEMIPARLRGRIDLAINGSYWLGAAVGAAITIPLLDPGLVAADIGWRVGFLFAGALGLVIIFVRRYIPESPRWLMTHGRHEEAEAVVRGIEAGFARRVDGARLATVDKYLTIKARGTIGFRDIARTLFRDYPKHSVLGLSLLIPQAFFYNAIFFTYGLVLTKFYGVNSDDIGLFILPFAAGNLLGPLLLGPLFDTIGRKQMITFTYILSGVLLAITGYLFTQGVLDAVTQTVSWTVIFFFASAGASSAYLTVSEIFPLEIRAMAIALFYSVGTGIGGLVGPWLFGILIATDSAWEVYIGYLIGAGLMVLGGVAEQLIGVRAERKPLEDIAAPITEIPQET